MNVHSCEIAINCKQSLSCLSDGTGQQRWVDQKWLMDSSQAIAGANGKQKTPFIKDLQNKTNKWKSGNISDVQVSTFGSNTAVAHYKFTYDADLNGTHRARTVICSDTWVNDSGTWKSAATHCSMVQGK